MSEVPLAREDIQVVEQFQCVVEAVTKGDIDVLRSFLLQNPELIKYTDKVSRDYGNPFASRIYLIKADLICCEVWLYEGLMFIFLFFL